MQKYSFLKMEEVFPSDNIIAKWIIGLGIVHNDLYFIKKRLIANYRKRDVSIQLAELPSLVRLLSASLREAIFYLEESEKEEKIKNYIANLPQDILDIYQELKPLFRNGNEAGILQRLTNIRNVTFHYSKPHRDEISRAIEGNSGFFMYEYEREQFLFAEAISNTIMIQALFKEDEMEAQQKSNVDAIIRRIHEAFYQYINFANQVVRHYLKNYL
ncbi:hypothetical protein [Paenibacillus elgii]|uniref:hypothetical protein n=1 Tax=Paenibacillus elgii TaxID=189691 RepID=UPI000FD7D92E|nr:hypothetical protein [Paenibacillus elgii]NEN82799.1 hypothetical protein [Paenibacillus elgii]